MIDTKDILKFVKHVHRRGQGVPDRRLLHPQREWLTGLSVSLVAILAGTVFSVYWFNTYQNIDSRTYTVSLSVPEYKRTVAQNVLNRFEERSAQYRQLRSTLSETTPTGALEVATGTKLSGTAWEWRETVLSDGQIMQPTTSAQFVLTFVNDELFSATTDCNTLSGAYTLDAEAMSFGPIAATKKACLDATLEAEFASQLETVSAIERDETAQQLSLLSEGGVMYFVTPPATEIATSPAFEVE